MKRFQKTVILIVALMTLTALCAASVLAVSSGKSGQVYQTYPSVDGQGIERHYYADFSKDIHITLMDLPAGDTDQCKLELSRFGDRAEDEKVQNLKRRVNDVLDSYIDQGYQASTRTSSVHVTANALRTIGRDLDKLTEFTLQYSMATGDGGGEYTPVWEGEYHDKRSVEAVENAVEAQNLTLSMIQLRVSPEDGWRAALRDGEDPDRLEFRATPGLGLMNEDERNEAEAAGEVVALRWVEAWDDYIYAVRDDSADGSATMACERPQGNGNPTAGETREKKGEKHPSVTEDSRSVKQRSKPGPTPTPKPDPLKLSVKGPDGRETALAAEDEEGKLAAGGATLRVVPGEFAVIRAGGEDGKAVKWSLGAAGEAAPQLEEGLPEAFSIEAGKRYTLSIEYKQSRVDIEVLGMISRPVVLESVQSRDAAGNATEISEGKWYNRALMGDALVITGSAQESAALKRALKLTTAFGEVIDLGEGALARNGEAWTVTYEVGGNLADVEGELSFEINYDADQDCLGEPDADKPAPEATPEPQPEAAETEGETAPGTEVGTAPGTEAADPSAESGDLDEFELYVKGGESKEDKEAEATPVPAEETPVPVEETPVPAEETPVPVEETPAPAWDASWRIDVDTLAPVGELALACGDRTQPADGGMFYCETGTSVTARFGAAGQAQLFECAYPLGEAAPSPELAVSAEGGATVIGYAYPDGTALSLTIFTDEEDVSTFGLVLTDPAGNQSAPREAKSWEIEGLGLSERNAYGQDGNWINLTAVGNGSITVSGTAHASGEGIRWRAVSDPAAEAEWQASPIEGGSWSVDIPLAGLPANGTLTLEAEYQSEAMRAAFAEPLRTSWSVDLEAPAAPALAAAENGAPVELADGRPGQVVTDNEVVLTVELPQEEGVSLYRLSGTRNGEALAVEAADHAFAFVAESGEYRFESTVMDRAGNESAPGALALVAAQPIQVLAPSGADEVLNAERLKADKGLWLDIASDGVRDDVKCVCDVNGGTVDVGRLEGGKWRAEYGALEKLGDSDPVTVRVRAYYEGLDAQKYGASGSVVIDLWKPEVALESVASCGIASTDQYFDGEPVALRVRTTGEEIAVTVNGEALEERDIAAYDAIAGAGAWNEKAYRDAAADGVPRYFLVEGANGDTLDITAVAADEAGNEATLEQSLEGYSTSPRQIRCNEPRGTITTRPEDTVTIENGSAMRLYRLVSDALEQDIPVDGDGAWSLELTYEDLGIPEDYPGDTWPVTLKYPSDKYNGEDIIKTVEIPVDVYCRLEWAEAPKEGDSAVSVRTDPGASVTLRYNGEEQKVEADKDGLAAFPLDTPLITASTITVGAVDACGNRGILSVGGEEARIGEAQDVHMISAEWKQTGRESAKVTGEAVPRSVVEAYLDGAAPIATMTTDDKGAFALDVDGIDGDSAVLTLKYKDLYVDNDKAVRTLRLELDHTPPALGISPDALSDVGGTLTITTDEWATVTFDKAVKLDPIEVDADAPQEVRLDDLRGIARVTARAEDRFGNTSEAVGVAVTESPKLKADFDAPEENAKVDSQGTTQVTGWVVASTDAPEELALVVEQGSRTEAFTLSAGGGVGATLIPDDDRLKDGAFVEAVGAMHAEHCWRFEIPLDMKEWEKGEGAPLRIALKSKDDAGETLAERGFVSAVQARRLTMYIAMSALFLVALVVLLAVVVVLTKRIKRISEGRVNPTSGMTRLTERSQQPPKR